MIAWTRYHGHWEARYEGAIIEDTIPEYLGVVMEKGAQRITLRLLGSVDLFHKSEFQRMESTKRLGDAVKQVSLADPRWQRKGVIASPRSRPEAGGSRKARRSGNRKRKAKS